MANREYIKGGLTEEDALDTQVDTPPPKAKGKKKPPPPVEDSVSDTMEDVAPAEVKKSRKRRAETEEDLPSAEDGGEVPTRKNKKKEEDDDAKPVRKSKAVPEDDNKPGKKPKTVAEEGEEEVAKPKKKADDSEVVKPKKKVATVMEENEDAPKPKKKAVTEENEDAPKPKKKAVTEETEDAPKPKRKVPPPPADENGIPETGSAQTKKIKSVLEELERAIPSSPWTPPDAEDGSWFCPHCNELYSESSANCISCGIADPKRDDGDSWRDYQRKNNLGAYKPSESSVPLSETKQTNGKANGGASKGGGGGGSKAKGPKIEEVKEEEIDPETGKSRKRVYKTRVDPWMWHTNEKRKWTTLEADKDNIRILLYQSNVGRPEHRGRLRFHVLCPAMIANGTQNFDVPNLKMQTPYATNSGNSKVYPYGGWLCPNPDLQNVRSMDEFRAKIRAGVPPLVNGPDLTPINGRLVMQENSVKAAKYRASQTDMIHERQLREPDGSLSKYSVDATAIKADFHTYWELLEHIANLHLMASSALTGYWILRGTDVYAKYKDMAVSVREEEIKIYHTPCLLDAWFYEVTDWYLYNPYQNVKARASAERKGARNYPPVQSKSGTSERQALMNKFRPAKGGSSITKTRDMFSPAQFLSTSPWLREYPKFRALEDIVMVLKKDATNAKALAEIKKEFPLFVEWIKQHLKDNQCHSQPHWEMENGMMGVSYTSKMATDEKHFGVTRKEPSDVILNNPIHKKWFDEGYRFNDLPMHWTFKRKHKDGKTYTMADVVPWEDRTLEQGDYFAPMVEMKLSCWPDAKGTEHARFGLSMIDIYKAWDNEPFVREKEVVDADEELLKGLYGEDVQESIVAPDNDNRLLRLTFTTESITKPHRPMEESPFLALEHKP